MEPGQASSAAPFDETPPRRLTFSILGLVVGLLGLLFAIFQPHLVEAIDPPPPPTKLADTLAEAGDKFVGRMLDRVRPGKGAPAIPVEPARPLPLRWYLAPRRAGGPGVADGGSPDLQPSGPDVGPCEVSPMTALLRQAISEIEALPADEQEAIASRWLAEVEDERRWSEQFAATTDDQWDRLVEEVHRDLAGGGGIPLDEVFPAGEGNM